VLLASAAAWLCESLVFLACAWALGLAAGLPLAVTVMASATLATLLPGAPGHVGTFHAGGIIAATTLFGLGQSEATALAILAHAALWLPVTCLGLLALLHGHRRAPRTA
jgi:uncharacterized membrane protein YbhN (UPF0104 family)